jgi:FkbM family methyltransferase
MTTVGERIEHMGGRIMRPFLQNSVFLKSILYRMLWMLPEKWRRSDEERDAFMAVARAAKGPVYFINIGANDGISGDQMREFILRYKWRGVLVEPVDFVFERLQKAYRRVPQVICEHAAIAEQDGEMPFWFIRQNNVLPPGYDQVGSFNRAQVAQQIGWLPGLEPYIDCKYVRCLTLSTLLSKHAMDRVDIIQIDTEGYDFEVIKQIDFAKFRPKVIVYEHTQLSSSDADDCAKRLLNEGYDLDIVRGNTVARCRNQAWK